MFHVNLPGCTCNGCLAHREKWAGNNAEKVRELWQKYHAEHREEINEKRTCIINLRWIVLCVGAELGKINGQDMWGLGSICWGLRGEVVMEKLVGMLGGQRVGWTDHQGYSLLYQCEAFYEMPSFVCRLPEPQCRAASGSIPTAGADWPARSSSATCHAVPHLGTASTWCARNDTCENMMNYGILL